MCLYFTHLLLCGCLYQVLNFHSSLPCGGTDCWAHCRGLTSLLAPFCIKLKSDCQRPTRDMNPASALHCRDWGPASALHRRVCGLASALCSRDCCFFQNSESVHSYIFYFFSIPPSLCNRVSIISSANLFRLFLIVKLANCFLRS